MCVCTHPHLQDKSGSHTKLILMCTQERNPVEFIFASCEIPPAAVSTASSPTFIVNARSASTTSTEKHATTASRSGQTADALDGRAGGDGAGAAETVPTRTVHLKKTGGMLGLALVDGNMVHRVQVCARQCFTHLLYVSLPRWHARAVRKRTQVRTHAMPPW